MEKQKTNNLETNDLEAKRQGTDGSEIESPDIKGQKNHEGQGSGTPVWQTDDVRGKIFFDNPELCAQFLRDYSGLEILKNVQPEDIEDVKLRYHLFDEVEYNSDAVKRIRLKSANYDDTAGTVNGMSGADTKRVNTGKPDMPMYIVSLIDHKTGVDYNVAMQFLRYEVCIWADWEKEMRDRGYGTPGQKGFRYPPILPIIYYEGSGIWTADLHLSGRIAMAEMFSEYIPDFTYRVVRNHDYSNDELMKRADEMSLLMMLGKIHKAGDIEALHNISPEQINAIMKKASPAVVDILARTVWALCRKMNLPENEAETYVRSVKEGKMGYIFENMEKMDIQEERRKTAEARQEADEARQEADEARQEADKAWQEVEEARQKLQENRRKNCKILIEVCRQAGVSREFVAGKLCSEYSLTQADAEALLSQYWV